MQVETIERSEFIDRKDQQQQQEYDEKVAEMDQDREMTMSETNNDNDTTNTTGENQEERKKSEYLTSDQGVEKIILNEGIGVERPVVGTEVSVHYTGKFLDGKVFDSSIERDECFKFTIGSNSVIKGWDIAVSSMRMGEKSKFVLKPEYAYGERGSPPKIAPNSTLEFEIELVDFNNRKDLTENKDGGVLKKTIKKAQESEYETPSFDTQVKINYKIYEKKKESQNDEDLNNDENLSLVFESNSSSLTVGQRKYGQGFDMALESLKLSEISNFIIKPEYAFGSHGSPELGIKPNSTTLWEVELLSMEKPPASWSLSDDEKVVHAQNYKSKGNSFYSAQDYKLALKYYQHGVKYVENSIKGDSECNKSALDIFILLNLNIGQTALKLNKYKKAIDVLNKVLDHDSSNAKAIYRLGMVNYKLSNFEEALDFFKKLVQLQHDNNEANLMLNNTIAKIKIQNQKDKKLYSSIFSKS